MLIFAAVFICFQASTPVGEVAVVPLEVASVEIMKMVEVAMIVSVTRIVMPTGMTGTTDEMIGVRREVRLKKRVLTSVF